jgi:hypothetical protein
MVLGGLGGLYASSDKNVVFLQFGISSFMRDIFGLFGLFWPLGHNYHINILNFQVENTFVFFLTSFIILIGLLFILYRFVKTKQRILIFAFLWIFITLIPVHNILITSWDLNSRYLYLPLVGFCLLISLLLFKLSLTKSFSSGLGKVLITAIILFIIAASSLLVIKHNERLDSSSKILERMVSDIKNKYQMTISDTTNIYFINFPISNISSESNLLVYVYLNDILNYSDNIEGFNKNFHYYFLLLTQGEKESEVNITWLDDRNFLIDVMNSSECLIIPNEFSHLDEQMKNIFKRSPAHAMMRSLPSEGGINETNAAVIKALKLDKELNRVKLGVHLKEPSNNSIKNNLFFIYKNGHIHLVKES